MTCTRYEPDLALYVEGDLPASLVPEVETHLRDCATCREVLAGLRASQEAVAALRDEPLSEEALAVVRALVASAHAPQPAPAFRWRWAVGAGLAAVAAAALWLAMPNVRAPHVPPAEVRSVAALPVVPAPTVQPRETEVRHRASVAAPSRSTVHPARRVSPNVEEANPVPALSREDADQLARAVVAISRITSVEDALREPAPPDPSPTPVVRLATADPNVVIYWRLDSNGGE